MSHRVRIIIPAVAAVVLAIAVVGCGGSSKSSKTTGGSALSGKKIGITLLDTTEPFYKDMTVGFNQEAAKLGWKLNLTAAEGDLAAQINQVQDFITNKVDAMILIPADSAGIVPAVRDANRAKIPVFTADIKADGGDVISHIASNNHQGGYMLGQYLGDKVLHGNGQVALLTYEQISSVNDRDRGFVAALKKYPNIKIVKKLEVGFTRDKARSGMENLLAGYPNLSAVFGSTGGDAGNGAVGALKAAHNTKIKVVTFDSIPENRELMLEHDPNLVADIAQFPYRIGIDALDTVAAHFQGKKVAKFKPVPVALITPDKLERKGKSIIIKGHEQDEPH